MSTSAALPRPLLRNLTLLRRVLRCARPYRVRLAGLTVLVVVSTALPLVSPFLYRFVVDGLVDGSAFANLVPALVLVGVVGVLAVACSIASSRAAGIVGYRVIADLQDALFARLVRMPLDFFTTVRPGVLVSRLTNDVNGTEPLFTSVIPTAIGSAVTLGIAAIVLAVIDLRLALVLLVVPVALVPMRFAERKINGLIRSSFEHNRELSGTIESVLSRDGVLLARTSGQTEAEGDRFRAGAAALRAVSVQMTAWRATAGGTYDVAFTLVTTITLAGGAWLVSEDEMSIGTLLLFLLYVRLVQAPLVALVGLRYPALRAGIAFERVFDVLESPIVPAPAYARPPQDGRPEADHVAALTAAHALELRAVRYRPPPASEVSIAGLSHAGSVIGVTAWMDLTALTPGSSSPAGAPRPWILDGVDVTVDSRELVAMVGASGAGKSTVALLAAGLIPPNEGQVLMRGKDATAYDEESLAASVAFITQDTFVLHDSVRNNLLYAAPGASEAELDTAIDAARLDRLVASLSDGYDTVIGEKGHRLSGGERQRLAIARAFLKQPAVVILDEPTSQLDARTEAEIKAAIADVFADRAVLMMAHRLSTIVDATRILVIDDGRIVEVGDHDSLMAADGAYASLYRTQIHGVAEVR